MAKLDIIMAPDPRLKSEVRDRSPRSTPRSRRLMDDMLETMYAAPGIGLAAPQVGVAQRVIVLDAAREGEKPQPLAHGQSGDSSGSPTRMRSFNEGCLSLPEHYADVVRPKAIKVRYPRP